MFADPFSSSDVCLFPCGGRGALVHELNLGGCEFRALGTRVLEPPLRKSIGVDRGTDCGTELLTDLCAVDPYCPFVAAY